MMPFSIFSFLSDFDLQRGIFLVTTVRNMLIPFKRDTKLFVFATKIGGKTTKF